MAITHKIAALKHQVTSNPNVPASVVGCKISLYPVTPELSVSALAWMTCMGVKILRALRLLTGWLSHKS